METTSERAKTFYLFMTRIGEGYKLSPSRNYTTFPALTGLAHSSRAKYRYNESLLEITNLTVKIQKSSQHIIKLINIIHLHIQHLQPNHDRNFNKSGLI